jgi:hypothetical protein
MHLFWGVLIGRLFCLTLNGCCNRCLRFGSSIILLEALIDGSSTVIWTLCLKIVENILFLRIQLFVLNLISCFIDASFIAIHAIHLVLSNSSWFRKWNFRIFLNHLLLILIVVLFTTFVCVRLPNLYSCYIVPCELILLEMTRICHHKFKKFVLLVIIETWEDKGMCLLIQTLHRWVKF